MSTDSNNHPSFLPPVRISTPLLQKEGREGREREREKVYGFIFSEWITAEVNTIDVFGRTDEAATELFVGAAFGSEGTFVGRGIKVRE